MKVCVAAVSIHRISPDPAQNDSAKLVYALVSELARMENGTTSMASRRQTMKLAIKSPAWSPTPSTVSECLLLTQWEPASPARTPIS